jgi:Domain of unknown function (DUF4153)
LVVWRQRGHDPGLVRAFVFAWAGFTVVPALVLIRTTMNEIQADGMTPGSYRLMMFSIWMLAMPAVFLVRGSASIRIIPGFAAILALVASIGPWSSFAWTAWDQTERLTMFLTERSVLVGGRFVAPVEDRKLAVPDQLRVATAVRHLESVGALGRLRPWFEGEPADPFASPRKADLGRRILAQLAIDECEIIITYCG